MSFTKATAIGSLAVLASAGLANPVTLQRVDHSNYDMYTAQIMSARGGIGLFTQYSDMEPGADGYVAFDDTLIEADGLLESAGIADYTADPASEVSLNQFNFIGGVDQVGGVVFFDFFDSTGGFVDGFGVQLSQAGTFSWSIDLAEAMLISGSGFVEMSIDDENLSGAGSTAGGRWFLGNNGATVGDAGAAEAAPDFNFNFELNSSLPAPSALALLGMGGVVAGRRRR